MSLSLSPQGCLWIKLRAALGADSIKQVEGHRHGLGDLKLFLPAVFWFCKHMPVYSILEYAGYWKMHEAHSLIYEDSTTFLNLSFCLLLLFWGPHFWQPREWDPQVASSFFGPLLLKSPSMLTFKKPRRSLKSLGSPLCWGSPLRS